MDSVELAGFQYHFMGFFFPKKKKKISQKEKDSHENDQDFLFKLEKRSTNLDSKNWQIIFSLFKL